MPSGRIEKIKSLFAHGFPALCQRVERGTVVTMSGITTVGVFTAGTKGSDVALRVLGPRTRGSHTVYAYPGHSTRNQRASTVRYQANYTRHVFSSDSVPPTRNSCHTLPQTFCVHFVSCK